MKRLAVFWSSSKLRQLGIQFRFQSIKRGVKATISNGAAG